MAPRQQQRQASRAVVRAEDRPAQGGNTHAIAAVYRELDNRLSIIEHSAAAGIKPERLKLVALTTFSRTPALLECDPVSVARAIVEAGQLGLEPTGLMGGAYLVPRGRQCTLLVGYRGLVMLAMRSQLVQRVEARVVRQKDVFEYAYGLEPYLRHVPSTDPDPGPYTGAYAVLFYRDGSRQFDYMSIAEIEAIRKRSSSPDRGPWVTDYAEMCKKTPLRRLMKMAPLTVEVAAAIDALDPEVAEQASTQAGDPRTAELRHRLQEELAREFGAPAPEPPLEGQYREAPTTHGGSGAAQGSAEAEGAQDASGASAEARTAPEPAGDGGTPAPGAAIGRMQVHHDHAPSHWSDEPCDAAPAEHTTLCRPRQSAADRGEVPQAAALCGASNAQLGAGPCAKPAGHPENEHAEAGGTRFTVPRRPAS